jgi:hypothetical protein
MKLPLSILILFACLSARGQIAPIPVLPSVKTRSTVVMKGGQALITPQVAPVLTPTSFAQQLTLAWNPTVGPDCYTVWSSIDLVNWNLFGFTTNTNWSNTQTNQMMFFGVKAEYSSPYYSNIVTNTITVTNLTK